MSKLLYSRSPGSRLTIGVTRKRGVHVSGPREDAGNERRAERPGYELLDRHDESGKRSLRVRRGARAGTDDGWPEAIRSRWGFSLCAGYLIIHSNPATRRLMHGWILKAYQSDDQVALNLLLLEHGMRWKHAGRVDGNRGVCRALGLTIEAIDQRRVTRTKDTRRIDPGRLAVFHPRLTGRTTATKLLQAVAGLARLRPRPLLGPVAIRASLGAARRWVWWMASTLFGPRFADGLVRRKRG